MPTTNTDEFYIGWQDKAPAGFTKVQGRFVWILGICVLFAGILLAQQQVGFSNARFDFGQASTLEGVLKLEPYPQLIIEHKDTPNQPFYQQVLLVGFGKIGAVPTLQAVETAQGQSLDGRKVKLQGTLFYGESKTLMELTDGVESVLEVGEVSDLSLASINLGNQQFQGEILDAKCYFGVMKPGEGKPHRSCAARCISGGVPPVLGIRNADEGRTFLLLVDEKGNPLNQLAASMAGQPVSICGEVQKAGEWYTLKVDQEKGIQALAKWKTDIPMCYN